MPNYSPYYTFNFGFGLLGNSMSSGTTSMTMAGGNNFPYDTTKSFKIVVWAKGTYPNPGDDPNAEIMTAVWSGSGNIFTVTRGDEGLSGVSHSSGDAVAAVITAQLIQSFGGCVPNNIQVFTSSGTWTKPVGVSQVYVKVIGAGGNGSSHFGSSVGSGAGGGAGGYAEGVIAVTGNVTVTIGATNSFAGSTTISATSGSVGGDGSNPLGGLGGAGGVGSNGTINLTGASGQSGADFAGIPNGGKGGDSVFGGGGIGGRGYNGHVPENGGNATAYGAGGGGIGYGTSSSSSGGTGDVGAVIVYW